MTEQSRVLTQEEILERIQNNNLTFNPELDQYQIQAHSVDLRLGFTFMVPKYWELTKDGREAVLSDYTETGETFEVIELEPGQYFEILPNEYVVFTALEMLKLPDDLMAVLYPRSSVNRRGLSVDLSGIVDAGYEGHLIIPVRNNTHSQVIRVYPGERFCQLVFNSLSHSVEAQQSRFHKKDVVNTVGSYEEKSQEETKYIRAGKIRELKEEYKLE